MVVITGDKDFYFHVDNNSNLFNLKNDEYQGIIHTSTIYRDIIVSHLPAKNQKFHLAIQVAQLLRSARSTKAHTSTNGVITKGGKDRQERGDGVQKWN